MSLKRKNKNSKFLLSILDAGSDAIFVLDNKYRIVFLNKAASGLLEDPDTALGVEYTRVLKFQEKTDAQDTVRQYIDKAIQNGEATTARDLSLLTKGIEMPIEITTGPIEDTGVLLKIKDYTAEHEKNQLQEDFISLASHEMRTPIAAAEGYIDLALNPNVSQIDEKARSCLDMAKSSIKNLSELFYNILDTSRLENSELRANFTTINLNEFIDRLSINYKILAEENQQEFSVNFKNSEPIFCNTDPVYLQESLDNLVSNAIKYTGEKGSVSVNVEEANGEINIGVTDTGVGLSKEELPKIFQKFYRVNEGESQVRGTGLGLYITKKRIEKISGKISVRSILGQGSTFTITLPGTTVAQDDVSQKQGIVVEEIAPLSKEDILASDQVYKKFLNHFKYPENPPNIFAYPFIKATSEWREGKIPSTSPEAIEKIYNAVIENNPDIPRENLEKYLVPFRKRLENPGLAKMMKFMTKSGFLIPWMLSSPEPLSWDVAFGWGKNLNDEWKEIPQSDHMHLVMIRDPEFIWVRYRSVLARREVAGKDDVLFLNAGALPELRYITYFPLPKNITACDNDKTIDPENIGGWSASKNNVNYQRTDLIGFLDKENTRGAKYDAIVMNNGSLKYYANIEKIIQMATKLLKPGGFFMFDVQFSHWDLVRAAYVFGIYPDVALVPDNKEVILERVAAACQKIWGLSYEYLEDPINKEPTSVMIKIKKVV